ncbi:MAG: hypothetical protein F6K47_31745 [Symploca sp. SIO2E6]|nr:hypothetical protein [Symploca sp. SIO2E6]
MMSQTTKELVKMPDFPDIPSTTNLNPWTDTHTEECQDFVATYNKQLEIDHNVLLMMNGTYENIEDKYKKSIAKLVKYTKKDVKISKAAGLYPNGAPSINVPSLIAEIGLTIAVPTFLFSMSANVRAFVNTELAEVHLGLQDAVMAAEGAEETAAFLGELAALEEEMIMLLRVARFLKIGGYVAIVAFAVYGIYELYHQRNELIRKLEQLKSDMSTNYARYNELANTQQAQAKALRNVIYAFNKNSLWFKVNGKDTDYAVALARSLEDDPAKRLSQTADAEKTGHEATMLKVLRGSVNELIEGEWQKIDGFVAACEAAFNAFKDGVTKANVRNNILKYLPGGRCISDTQLDVIYDESSRVDHITDAEFFEIYLTPEQETKFKKILQASDSAAKRAKNQ